MKGIELQAEYSGFARGWRCFCRRGFLSWGVFVARNAHRSYFLYPEIWSRAKPSGGQILPSKPGFVPPALYGSPVFLKLPHTRLSRRQFGNTLSVRLKHLKKTRQGPSRIQTNRRLRNTGERNRALVTGFILPFLYISESMTSASFPTSYVVHTSHISQPCMVVGDSFD